MKLQYSFVFVALIAEVFSTAERLGCKDEKGNLIDWYYLYKLPNSYNHNGVEKSSNSGMNYLFITPSSTSQWTLSKRLLNDLQSMPGLTLAPAYNKSRDDVLVMMYNDEPPEGKTDGARGHTKGVVIANDISGLWLVHSVPKYPPQINEAYNYPKTGTLYGQSFLCISFTGDEMSKVGKQLSYNEPHFYSSRIPDYLRK